MLVEINLLPKKEPKRKSKIVWILVVLFLTLLLAGLFIWQYTSKKTELKATESTLESTTNLVNTYTQNLTSYNDSSSVKDLEIAIEWADSQSLDYVVLLQGLTKNLPDRGFIQDLSLSDGLVVNVIVQFDTKADAAYYLNSIQEIDWVEEAVLTEAKSTDVLEDQVSERMDEAIDSLKKADIEPRYFANYAFVINKARLQAEMKEKQAEEEGEDSP